MAIVGVAPADDDGAEASKPAPKAASLEQMDRYTKGFKACLEHGADAGSLPRIRQGDSQAKVLAAIAELSKIYTALTKEPS